MRPAAVAGSPQTMLADVKIVMRTDSTTAEEERRGLGGEAKAECGEARRRRRAERREQSSRAKARWTRPDNEESTACAEGTTVSRRTTWSTMAEEAGRTKNCAGEGQRRAEEASTGWGGEADGGGEQWWGCGGRRPPTPRLSCALAARRHRGGRRGRGQRGGGLYTRASALSANRSRLLRRRYPLGRGRSSLGNYLAEVRI